MLSKSSYTGSSSFLATGTIEGKFDCGYLVSVQLGSEVISGVLYHPDQADLSTSIPQYNGAVIPYTRRRRSRHSGHRRRSRRAGDPSYPKPNRSGYNFYFAEKHYKLKSLYPNREREFTKMIGESWSNLSSEERMVQIHGGPKTKLHCLHLLAPYYLGCKKNYILHVDVHIFWVSLCRFTRTLGWKTRKGTRENWKSTKRSWSSGRPPLLRIEGIAQAKPKNLVHVSATYQSTCRYKLTIVRNVQYRQYRLINVLNIYPLTWSA